MRDSEIFEQAVNRESKILIANYGGPDYHAVQNIVRRMDVVLPLFWSSENWSKKEVLEYRELFKFGWAPLMRQYYNGLNIAVNQPYPLMTDGLIKWTESNITFSGKIEFCRQLLSYEKAGLIDIKEEKQNHFNCSFLSDNIGLEQFDNLSRDYFKETIVERVIERKKKEKEFDEEKIKNELRKIIKCPDGKLISYNTTPEIDDYYNQKGHFQVLRMQGYDEFDTKDKFGSIEYWKYVDLIEILVGVALMHTDACLELRKLNENVNLHNILSYTYSKKKTIKIYSNYLGVTEKEINQIFSCITLSKDNFDYYLEYPATPPPMYFQVSEDLIIRSIAGCLENPFSLLNRELKRRYKKDYDRAVNKREERFRNELYMFFPQEHIIKIKRDLNLSFRGMKTDIDAVLFDKETGTLGLFQLKWQDPYYKSMKERFSRISNLFPKAEEWVEKMKFWVSNNTSKEILSSLQIYKKGSQISEISNICVFVISRNTMNFTGMNVDESVAWCSWYQLIESQIKVKAELNDPIKEMFVKAKSMSPMNRPDRKEILQRSDFETQIGKIKVKFK
jgi:hypothetical protein